MQILVADWDGGSIHPGPSANAEAWRSILPSDGVPTHFLHRRLGSRIPALVELMTLRARGEGRLPILLGGDHSLTWHTVTAIASQTALQILLFDAHHDSWPENTLTNYSVMRELRRRGVRIVGRGIREDYPHGGAEHELTLLPRIPVYISIDIDVVNPAEVSAVNFPVEPTSPPVDYSLDRVLGEIETVFDQFDVVGMDVVEWCSARAVEHERIAVSRFVTRLLALAEAVSGSTSSGAGATTEP